MSQHKDKFIIIDGNALLHRAWHALPETMKAPDGTITNAAYGFTMILLKAIKELRPQYIAVCFDAKGPNFRDKLYKEYKAQREKKPQELYDQIKVIQEILDAFGIRYFQKKGVEADDVIGTLCRNSKLKTQNSKPQLKTQNFKVIIVTGDLDTLQLVDSDTEVYTLKKGITETMVYNIEEVKKRYDGLTPEQLCDYKALAGDQSDNIPGAKGIGDKTAIELIKAFGSVENLYQQLEKHSESELSERFHIRAPVFKKIQESKQNVLLSKKLVQIKQTVPISSKISSFIFGQFKLDAIVKVFQKYAFRSLIRDIQPIAELYDVKAETVPSREKEQKYFFIDTKEKVKDFMNKISVQKIFALDTETDSLDVISNKLVGISISWKTDEAYYIPASLTAPLKPLLESREIKKVGHNMKFDWHSIQNAGIDLQGIYFDTMVAAYLINPGSRQYSLDGLVFQHFGASMQKIEELIGKKGSQPQLSMADVDPQKVAKYSAEDAAYTWLLYEKFNKELLEKGVEKVFHEIEMPLLAILGEMEKAGIALNIEVLKRLDKIVSKDIQELEHKIYSLTGAAFNINSPKQLKEILFGKLQIQTKGIRKTKTGISTAATELEKMRGAHPVVDHIFEYRELAKLKSTYIDALPILLHRSTRRIHTSFNQVITTTGRLSSTDPNMQNIPVKGELGREIRRAFIASSGCRLLSLDYSQIDLRVAAHLSKDENMIETFNKDLDIHTTTAARLFNKKEDDVNSEERRRAKEANFGVLYGLGPRGLSERLDVSFEEAEDFIERYRSLYPHVFLFLQAVIESTRKRGFAETLYGRRRYLPDINSGSPVLRAGAERAAINMPVQGTAADIIKKAMININSKLKTQNHEEILMLLQVHDELVFEVKEEKVQYWTKIIKYEMENAVKLRVPLKVEAKVGRNWKEMEPI